ncbi:DUF4760 domain-containing protein [Burkholderia sp. Bp9031]|uniref:DUF4760 domain-containing protein n=1 Tax=Burkholderia sp. Bp9031 TaxID=2184566 RepID=UPI00071660DE|nr:MULTISPECIES: DUF4760 domain-containing protein [Burkholderia]RQZ16692.1 DUF4760 domain-containing protein [Burkholderia sp. Bp9031]
MKPRRILTFLLLVVVALVAILIGEERFWHWGTDPKTHAAAPLFRLTRQNWGVVLTVAAAVIGWICTSLVSIQNSVKQHTVNTLLQSRLSATFIEKGNQLNRVLLQDGVRRKLTLADCAPTADKEHTEGIEAVRYMLNYYEFIAVGIRQADLDERLLRQTIRAIVCGLVIAARVYIEDSRKHEHEMLADCDDGDLRREGPRTYRNLLWLYERWKDRRDPQVT